MKYSAEHIDRFLKGELAPEDHARFELDLLKDENLKRDVELHREMMNYLNTKVETDQALNALSDVHKSYVSENQGSKTRWMWYGMAAAASILAFFAISRLLQSEVDTDLFNKYFETDEASFVTRNDSTENLLIEGQEAFNSQDFARAITAFTQFQSNQPTPNRIVNYHLGQSYMANGQFSEAKNLFQEMISVEDFMQNDLKWYLALCYVFESEFREAQSLLSDIPATSARSQAALALMNEIEEKR